MLTTILTIVLFILYFIAVAAIITFVAEQRKAKKHRAELKERLNLIYGRRHNG